MLIEMPRVGPQFKTILPGLALAIASMAGAFALSLRPPLSGPVAAIFPPWWSNARALVAAATGGSIVRLGAWRSIVVVAPRDADAAAQLERAGAWLVLDPRVLGGCASR